MATATIIGSGPNGLSAAIVLASAGLSTTVLERNSRIGGACSTGEITLPGYSHDLGSSVYPLGIASPFFRSLPIEIPWIVPAASCAHPLDDGTAVLLKHSVDYTIANLDSIDRPKYRSLIEPLATHFDVVVQDILGPVQHIPQHPFPLVRFGLSALLPAASLARSRFSGVRARALFAGIAAHSVLSLEASASAAVALVLMAAGNTRGWPIVRGGAQTLTDVLARHLESLYGGRIETGCEVTQLPEIDLVLADITPPSASPNRRVQTASGMSSRTRTFSIRRQSVQDRLRSQFAHPLDRERVFTRCYRPPRRYARGGRRI